MLRAALKRSIKTYSLVVERVPTHTMLRAALKQDASKFVDNFRGVSTHTMLRAALKHKEVIPFGASRRGLDTHNAACGIDSKTALRVLSVTQSRFRMQKSHSNLDDAAHRC